MTNETLTLILILLPVGLAAGFIAGLLGVGGGFIIVPCLFFALHGLGIADDGAMHIAVGTSLASIIVTSISSFRAHLRRDAVDRGVLRVWGPFVAAGAFLGAEMASQMKGPVLTAIFGTLALLIALQMSLSSPDKPWRPEPPAKPWWMTIGGLIGFISALLGIGGGSLTVPALVLTGTPIHRAVGTASAVGLVVAVPGTIGMIAGGWEDSGGPAMALGHVSLLALAVIAPLTVLTAPLGARAAHALPVKALKRIFALVLAITGGKMLMSLIG